eukprot:m.121360 g.121360  ORF g.121360 m.121360 type:complete len:238 (+) comp13704_c0_seq11:382-1095(+)
MDMETAELEMAPSRSLDDLIQHGQQRTIRGEEIVAAYLPGDPSKTPLASLFHQWFGPDSGHCHRQWGFGQIAYRCLDCQKLNVTAFCETCFIDGGHDKHSYVMYVSGSGGSCDCGIESAMDPDHFCPSHQHIDINYELAQTLFQEHAALLQPFVMAIDTLLELALELVSQATFNLVPQTTSIASCPMPLMRSFVLFFHLLISSFVLFACLMSLHSRHWLHVAPTQELHCLDLIESVH